jgi:chromodomain-helicase-DNA-binding protein 4
MLQSLKQSTEPKSLVDEARHYLYGVRKDLVMRRRKAEERSSMNKRAAGSVPQVGPSNPGQGFVGPQVSPSVPPPQVTSRGGHAVTARNYQGPYQDPYAANRYYSPLAPPAGVFQARLPSQVSRPPPAANHPTTMSGQVPENAPHAHPFSMPPWQLSERPQ